MSSDKTESLSELWGTRFDDRDDEDLSQQVWSRTMALRERAMAEPIKGFSWPEDSAQPSSQG